MIAGRYELLERLEPGWRARDNELGREVVVLIGDEAEDATTPAHSQIGRLFDRGEADGEPFAVFEYLPEAEPPTLIQAPPPVPARRRLPSPRTLAILAGVVLIATAGIGAAFLATTGSSSTDKPTTSLSVPVPTGTSAPPTEESEPPPTETERETTTQATKKQKPKPKTPPKPKPAPQPTVPATTVPPEPTTEPPLPTEPPPPTTTEEPPPTTNEEPPPATTG